MNSQKSVSVSFGGEEIASFNHPDSQNTRRIYGPTYTWAKPRNEC